MKLYITRHGQTEYNVNKLMVGRTDIPLNEKGIEQAQETRKLLKDIKFDVIISSPLIRTKQTAEILNINDVPIIYDERLLERDCGELTGKKREDVNIEAYWNYYDETKYERVEDIKGYFKRIYGFLDDIKEKYKDKTVLLVTHMGVTRVIKCYFDGIPENGDISKLGIKNCEVKMFEI